MRFVILLAALAALWSPQARAAVVYQDAGVLAPSPVPIVFVPVSPIPAGRYRVEGTFGEAAWVNPVLLVTYHYHLGFDQNSAAYEIYPPVTGDWQGYGFDFALPERIVNGDDFEEWTGDLRVEFWLDNPSGRAVPFSITLSAVPEPATWALMALGIGLAGAGLRRRPVAAAPAIAA